MSGRYVLLQAVQHKRWRLRDCDAESRTEWLGLVGGPRVALFTGSVRNLEAAGVKNPLLKGFYFY